MISFPLPILTFALAVVAGAVVFRLDLGPRLARGLFLAFFATVGLGSLMVGLRFGYGVEALVPVQRVLPLLGGPLLYLGFAVLSVPRARARLSVVVHLGSAAVLGLCLLAVGGRFEGGDLLVPLSFCAYAVGILWLRRKGANGLTRARLEMVPGILRMMVLGAVFLLAFGLIDGIISLSFALERRGSAMALISGGSVVLIAVLAGLIMTLVRGEAVPRAVSALAAEPEEDLGQMAQDAEAFLLKSQLYLDTDLTVDRLAKRLHVPARVLSAAINQQNGMNVSQYVNGFRLRHAEDLLGRTDLSVVKVMEQSGFLTRSNFYREFQRAYGVTPAAFRARGARG